MTREFISPEYASRKEDYKMISWVLDSPVDKPGSWAKKPSSRIHMKPLSCAEVLPFELTSGGNTFVSLDLPERDKEAVREKIEKQTVEFIINEGRNRVRNFDFALLKTALVAECLPNECRTNQMDDWLITLRGEKPVFPKKTENVYRRIISTRFGFTGDPATYEQVGKRHGRSGCRARQIVMGGCLRLHRRYKDLINKAFQSPDFRRRIEKFIYSDY